MKKNLKPMILIMAVVIGGSFMAFNVNAKDRVENTALNDYIVGRDNNNSVVRSKRSTQEQPQLTLSEENLIIYSAVKGRDLSSILKKTDETLWFIMKDGVVDGMVVVNNEVPIKMGGQNRSKELKRIYDKVKKQVKNIQDIKYLEIQGQGVLIVASKDEVYLTNGSRQLLNLEGKEKVSGNEFITALNKVLR